MAEMHSSYSHSIPWHCVRCFLCFGYGGMELWIHGCSTFLEVSNLDGARKKSNDDVFKKNSCNGFKLCVEERGKKIEEIIERSEYKRVDFLQTSFFSLSYKNCISSSFIMSISFLQSRCILFLSSCVLLYQDQQKFSGSY